MTESEPPSWADFQPSRLRKVRRAVIEAHPNTRERLRASSGSRLKDLKAEIASGADDPEALRRLARQLSGSDLRGLAGRLGPWEELREAVRMILAARLKVSFFPHVWSTWQRYPRVDEVRDLLQKLGDEFGWSHVAESYEQAVQTWIDADSPGRGIQEWLDGQGLSYSDLPDIAGLPIGLDTPLVRYARNAVMTAGSAQQLQTEGPARLEGWFHELEPPGRKLFGQNYLSTIDPQRWAPSILELLHDRYDLPDHGRASFWDRVPEDRRTAFRRWFIERNLEEALGAGTDRHAYWKGWSKELRSVELDTAGRVEYAVLRFESFGVIEFFETGNAAYFYPLDRLDKIKRKSASSPSDLKVKLYPNFGRSGDNRLIHMSGWQGKADRQVRAWKRGTS